MKKLVLSLFTVLSFFLLVGFADSQEKTIIGSWFNPRTYISSGVLKGFKFMKNGKCEAINIPSLDLKTWKIEDGCLVISGFELNDDGTRSEYNSIKPIKKLNRDTLMIQFNKKTKADFIYVNLKNLKSLEKSGKLSNN